MKLKFNSQQGFTLVEVLTVMLVLVAIASITVESTKDFVFQGRYDVTKDRYEKIKKAIIGDPNQVINGQPNIEGFVKDEGRFPTRLNELLGNVCDDVNYSTKSDCETNGKKWLTKAYLSSSEVLKDGWGNDWAFCLGENPDITNPTTCNSPSTPITNKFALSLQSKGKDGNINAADTSYDEDYPKATALPSIKHSDWTIDVNALKVLINADYYGSCNVPTCSDPSYTDATSCEKDNKAWNVTDNVCVVSAISNQAACEALPTFTWDSAKNYCKDNRYTTGTNCTVTLRSWGAINSKDNCEASHAQWTQSQKDILLKINSIPSNNISITEDGHQNLKSFSFANNIIPMGQVSIGVYYASDTNLTYPSICTDTNNHANFTEANCLANSGSWKNDGTEKYCYGLTQAIDCTGTTSPQLGGTLKPEIKLTLYPNTTLPTINW